MSTPELIFSFDVNVFAMICALMAARQFVDQFFRILLISFGKNIQHKVFVRSVYMCLASPVDVRSFHKFKNY